MTEAASPSKPINWMRMTRSIVEFSALISAIAFGVSCSMNSWVFAKWGYSFLQMASPTDVLMSGTRFIGILGIPLISSVVLGFVAVKVIITGADTANALDKVKSNVIPKRVRVLLSAIITITIILTWVGITIHSFILLAIRDLEPRYIIVVYSGFLIAVGAACVWDLRSQLKPGEIAFTIFALFLTFSSLILGFGLAAGWIKQEIDLQSANGFEPTGFVVQMQGKNVCGENNRLLWRGTDAILVECMNANGNKGVVAFIKYDKLEFVPKFLVARAERAKK